MAVILDEAIRDVGATKGVGEILIIDVSQVETNLGVSLSSAEMIGRGMMIDHATIAQLRFKHGHHVRDDVSVSVIVQALVGPLECQQVCRQERYPLPQQPQHQNQCR